ncbi:MAG: hypothetical protein LIV24_09975 [Eubacterium sp.]|nr:hypothetical protein [Eubacterium sp.]
MKAKFFKVLTGSLIAASMLTAALPAGAAVLSETVPSGDMAVQGTVTEEPETASYLIAVPTTVDFGNLRQPAENVSSLVNTNLEVKCTQYNLSNTNQAVAVLVKDKTSTDRNFYITGSETSNSGKSLKYSISLDNIDISTRNFAADGGAFISDLNGASGYLYCAFQGTGTKNGTLTLNQQQLYGQNIKDYVGMYKGTVTFSTTIVNKSDYTSVLNS